MLAARTSEASISSSTMPWESFIELRVAIISSREGSSRLASSPVMSTTRWGPGGKGPPGLPVPAGGPSLAGPLSRAPPASGRAGGETGAEPPLPALPPAPPLPALPPDEPPLPALPLLPAVPGSGLLPLPPRPPLPAVGTAGGSAPDPGAPDSGVHEPSAPAKATTWRTATASSDERNHRGAADIIVSSCFYALASAKKSAKPKATALHRGPRHTYRVKRCAACARIRTVGIVK